MEMDTSEGGGREEKALNSELSIRIPTKTSPGRPLHVFFPLRNLTQRPINKWHRNAYPRNQLCYLEMVQLQETRHVQPGISINT